MDMTFKDRVTVAQLNPMMTEFNATTKKRDPGQNAKGNRKTEITPIANWLWLRSGAPTLKTCQVLQGEHVDQITAEL